MAEERNQLKNSNITNKIPSSFIDRHGSVGQITLNEILNAFKDGVTDAMIHGTRDEKQSHHYYKQGYDFGIDLFCKQEEWTHE